MRSINLEQWIEEYKPIFIGEELKDFDLYRNELKQFKNENIWTEVECDNETFYIIPGLHIVNKFKIFITEKEWESEDIEVNDNEMITILDAMQHCWEFAQSINIQLSINDLSDFFTSNTDKEIEIPLGKAKYLTIEFIENHLDDELNEEQQDSINDYFSQL